MTEIELGYGEETITFNFDTDRFSLLAQRGSSQVPLTDVEIGAAFDTTIDSPPLDELISDADSVLIVVSDATRATGSAHWPGQCAERSR